MPVMPRTDKKMTAIAFSILGTPSNMRKKKRKKVYDRSVIKSDINFQEMAKINPK
jgi:hypothetical protein